MFNRFTGEQNQLNALGTQWAFPGSANDSYYVEGHELNKQYMEGVGMGGIDCVPVPSPQWIHNQQIPQNYVQFLAENVVPEVQVDALAEASDSRLVDGYAGVIAQEIRYPGPYYEGVPLNCFTGSENQVGALVMLRFYPRSLLQSYYEEKKEVQLFHDVKTCIIGWQTWEPRGNGSHASGPCSEASAAGSSYPSKISRKSKAALSDLRRRMRIAEGIEALGGLFPCSKQGGRADQVDEIIDHIKYLQFQIKDLSRSRLGGEPTSIPFAFLEGCGHCILDEQLIEPLEETIGKLLELNPSMATQLLENKGLFVMPMALAEELQHHE